MEEVVKWLKALVYLQVQSAAAEGHKPEIVLSKAGLSNAEIGELLDKTPDSVRKVIARAKTRKAQENND